MQILHIQENMCPLPKNTRSCWSVSRHEFRKFLYKVRSSSQQHRSVPYHNILGHTYHWFITDLIYTHDGCFYDNETDQAVYEDTLREEYLNLPLEEREEKTYVQYVNNCLDKNGTLRREK